MSDTVKKLRGKQVLIGSCIFTAITITLVLYDEKRQRDRRQTNVKYRLLAIKQKDNMAEYAMQKERAERLNTSN